MDELLANQTVLERQVAKLVETGMNLAVSYGLKFVGAVVILVLGWIAAGVIARAVGRGLSRFSGVDRTFVTFISSIVRYTVLIGTVAATLASVGVQTTSFVAVLGAMGLAVGLALQGTLSHVASGFMLVMFRPFRVGDYVEAGGAAGHVSAITLFTTELSTLDNIKVVLPNGAVWGGVIKNFTGNAMRRIDVEVGIAYEDSIDAAFTAARGVVEAEALILKDPPPVYGVSALADSSVNILVRVWVKSTDVVETRLKLNKALKEAFDKAGITIPFPQRVVHHIHENVAKDAE